MIIKGIQIEKFRAIEEQEFCIGRRLTAIAGRNGTMKSTLLGMLGQPFSISSTSNPMYGTKTIEGYNFRSQFQEKFCLSKEYDHVGEHVWTLKLFNSGLYNGKTEYKVKSAARKQSGHADSIRFINAEGKSRGMGYIQLPVIYLSLGRLFPIGESGKTKSLASEFTEDEKKLYIKWYKEILSIQSLKNPTVGMEKKDLKRVFTGVGDDTHDVTTCSAGEGNVGRVLTSILSFKRLKDTYGKAYKGGILLIDELDATLYGYAQKVFIRFLNERAKEYKLQIIFTTHSPLILREVNNLQRQEVREKKIAIDEVDYSYDNEIIYLTPKYTDDGNRIIKGENIHSATQLRVILNDIELKPTRVDQDINLYLEDERATDFLKHIFQYKGIIIENYVNFVEVDMSWTNYLQLHKKGVPEFRNSIIVLDHDVEKLAKYEQKQYLSETENVILMPEDVEKGMFAYLKSHEVYNRFEQRINENNYYCPYDVCFSDWTEDAYDTNELKRWFAQLTSAIGGTDLLYDLWIEDNGQEVENFINLFVEAYNKLAEKMEMDFIIC